MRKSALALSVDVSGVYVAGDTTGTLPGQISFGDTDAFVRMLVKMRACFDGDLDAMLILAVIAAGAKGENWRAALLERQHVALEIAKTNTLSIAQVTGMPRETVRRKLDMLGIPHLPNPSQIIPVMVGDAKKCKMISDWLMDNHGIYVQPINFPTVPRGTERLRFTPSPVHGPKEIDALVRAMDKLWSHCALNRAALSA